MKKIVVILGLVLMFSCGGPSPKKEKFEYTRVPVETSAKGKKEVSKTPVDLDNKGIGPIEDFEFPENIDSELAAVGQATFKQKCTACHKTNARLIGPAMQGIYERRHPAWVLNIMLNPTQMLKEDPIAKALLKEYNNVLMLNQNLSQEEARALAEYLRTL